MSGKWVKVLFIVAGLYDGILGIVFLAAPGVAFRLFEVVPPNHMGYVRFPALLLLVFAAMFFSVAVDPARKRELILYGCGLKVAYCATVFGYEITQGIPSMWIPWAWADLGFLGLFIAAWIGLGKSARPSGRGTAR